MGKLTKLLITIGFILIYSIISSRDVYASLIGPCKAGGVGGLQWYWTRNISECCSKAQMFVVPFTNGYGPCFTDGGILNEGFIPGIVGGPFSDLATYFVVNDEDIELAQKRTAARAQTQKARAILELEVEYINEKKLIVWGYVVALFYLVIELIKIIYYIRGTWNAACWFLQCLLPNPHRVIVCWALI